MMAGSRCRSSPLALEPLWLLTAALVSCRAGEMGGMSVGALGSWVAGGSWGDGEPL